MPRQKEDRDLIDHFIRIKPLRLFPDRSLS